jgi:threonine dehydrogenase-like Zn-dependent dehydrogenase
VEHGPPPPPRARQVKLRMLEIGLCGTDREIAEFKYGTPPAGSPYLVIGHESLGEVVEVGADVSDLKAGDLAVLMVRRPCPHPECVACRAGRQDFCYTGDYTERGIKGAHGFMTEFVVDAREYLVRVPRELRDVAVLTEPLTIAEKALEQVWQVQQRLPWACPVEPGRPPEYCHKAVVIGAGPVGLLGVMVLAAAGFQTFVYSREPASDPRAALVGALGATYVCSAETTVDELAARVGNIDLIYEAAGASRVAFDVMRVLGTNGIFIFTGVPGRKAPIEVDTDLIMRDLVLKNQVVFGTVNAGREAFEAAVRDLGRFVQRWPSAVRGLITGHYPMSQAGELLTGPPRGIKNVITVNS